MDDRMLTGWNVMLTSNSTYCCYFLAPCPNIASGQYAYDAVDFTQNKFEKIQIHTTASRWIGLKNFNAILKIKKLKG